jgi:threonine/homoserine/homoserine lactone efflux protein
LSRSGFAGNDALFSPQLWAYLILTFALVITPGATTAIVVRNTINGGWRRGAATAFGAAAGNSTHAAAARLGLVLVLQRWPIALVILKWGGALYLGWMGISSLRRSVDGGVRVEAGPSLSANSTALAAFRQGLTVNLLNPPIIVFYLVVVPTFLPAGAGVLAFTALAAIHVVMAFICHLGWAFVFDRLSWLVRGRATMRWFEMGAAAALLYLAVRTALRP